MSLVIVTKRCYLICESVTSIIIEPAGEREGLVTSNGLFKKKAPKPTDPLLMEWTIEINYIPVGPKSLQSNSGYGKSSESGECISILVTGFKDASILFHEIVGEIREQCPDILFLDKLINDVLMKEEV